MRSDSQVPPYSQIALFYDDLMAHVDYKEWAKYIDKLVNRYGHGFKNILDMGCGTGTIMKQLQNYDYSVCGFDLSFSMLRIAKRKQVHQLWQGDARALACKPEFDVVICLYDTIHYFPLTEIPLLMKNVTDILKKGGLFIFDAITEKLVRTYWANFTEQEEISGVIYLRHSHYDNDTRCQHTDFEIQSGNDIYFESHTQWIYPLKQIESLIRDSGLSCLGCFDELSLKQSSELSERVHYVVRKEAH